MLERVMMIAGEVSGDLHGSGVVRELKKRLPGLKVFGVGGDLMEAEGMELLFHIRKFSVMGFAEVIRHLPFLRKVESVLEDVLETRRPEVVVMIDYPGFNLRFARKVKQLRIKVLYYISPQLWAWHRGRIRHIRSCVDEMNVVFPFEEEIYREEGVPVRFVGHPLLERLGHTEPREEFFTKHGLDPEKQTIGLFPGSRVQELRRILPAMMKSARLLRERFGAQAAVGLSRGLEKESVRTISRSEPDVRVLENATYALMEHADVAIVTSGTATLETAWFGTPMIVVYRTSPLTFFLGRMLVKIPWIGLVNIVSGRKIVPELLQGDMTPENIADLAGHLLSDEAERRRIRTELLDVRHRLGSPGASSRVAENIITLAEAA